MRYYVNKGLNDNCHVIARSGDRLLAVADGFLYTYTITPGSIYLCTDGYEHYYNEYGERGMVGNYELPDPSFADDRLLHQHNETAISLLKELACQRGL